MKFASDKVMTGPAAALARRLKDRPKPVNARTLAACLGIAGNVESRKRIVRKIVEHLRETCGRRVCANNDGYWLAESATEWAAYLAAQKSGLVFGFVRLKRAKVAVADRMGGQGSLFTKDVEGSKAAWAKA